MRTHYFLTSFIFFVLPFLANAQYVQQWENWQSDLHINKGVAVSSPTGRNVGLHLWGDKGFGMELHYRDRWGTAIFTRATDEAIWLGNYGVNQTGQQAFTPWMTLRSGNVGIGTTNPQGALHIVNNNNIQSLLLEGNTAGWGSGLTLRNTAPNGKAYGIYSSAWGTLNFSDNVTGIDRIFINSNGNVGLSTTNTPERLTLDGNIMLAGANPTIKLSNRLVLQMPIASENNLVRSFMGQNISWNDATKKWSIPDQTHSDFSMIRFENGGTITFINRTGYGATPEMTNGELEVYKKLTINENGTVGIGTTDTKGYKLAVNGDAIFTKVKVKQYGAWPDYVFSKIIHPHHRGNYIISFNETNAACQIPVIT